jgi:hypothetical protein
MNAVLTAPAPSPLPCPKDVRGFPILVGSVVRLAIDDVSDVGRVVALRAAHVLVTWEASGCQEEVSACAVELL